MDDRQTLAVGQTRKQLRDVAARVGRLGLRGGEYVELVVEGIVELIAARPPAPKVDEGATPGLGPPDP